MTTKAFVGKVFLYVGNGGSPEEFAKYCEIDDMSGIGVKNDTVDATTFCSGGVKEYIAGLGDGNEVTFQANYSLDDPIQDQLMDDVDSKATRNFEVQAGDSSPGEKLFKFALAMLSWEFDPSVSSKNAVKYTGKITGQIIRT